ncbi:MAG: alpha/beta hydrolase [Eubacteriales bacterium]|nr:alpha/beta hydrolase [Eubacteriales bacterium]
MSFKNKLKAAKRTVKTISAKKFGSMDYQAERKLAELKKFDPIRIFAKKLDVKIQNDAHEVPARIFFASEEQQKAGLSAYAGGVLLFLHGGGWVTESVDTYERICSEMAETTGDPVLAVEYRRAPEDRFPTALLDCYAAAKALYTGELLPAVKPGQITLIGDSAGGNLAAALCLMARDRGEFMPERLVLVYPALWNDYSEQSPYASVRENGTGYILTSEKMREYLDLYQRTPADRENPYFAPLLEKNLSGFPGTLVLTAELDPLRDEGEDFAAKLAAAGNEVSMHRIEKAQHGFFALGFKQNHVAESLTYIVEFLKKTEAQAEGAPAEEHA